MQPVFRFAPSPNGHLHLGHAYSALMNARLAAKSGGRFVLRIEDIDVARCTEALVCDCLDDLNWLGLEWEEPVLRQSRQFARYRAAAEELEARGLVYPCFCTRGEIAAASANGPRDPDGAPVYPHICRNLEPALREAKLKANIAHAMRLDMTRALAMRADNAANWREEDEAGIRQISAPPERWGDVVLVRKDCPTSYHLSVVLDDALQGVTHVVRGMDLFGATAIHRVLQDALGLPAPLYRHHALIYDATGRKLSKSEASTPLRQLRAEGVTPADIRAALGYS